MKKLSSAFTIIFALAASAWASDPAPPANLHAVHLLTNEQADKQITVSFEATVTYRRHNENTLFVQDGSDGIYVFADAKFKAVAGDRVLITGKTKGSFHPIVIAESVTVLRHGELPKPAAITYDDMSKGLRDCDLVSIRGVVRSADAILTSGELATRLALTADGHSFVADLNETDPELLNSLLDAEVEVTGVLHNRYDGKMEPTAFALSIPSLAQLTVIKRAPENPWSLPITPMDQILFNYRDKNLSPRIRVHGIITYYHPGSTIVLQDGAKSIWIQTQTQKPLRVGSDADVIGFPSVHDGFLNLTGGEVQEGRAYKPETPQVVTMPELTSSRHLFDLVAVEGELVMSIRENSQDEYMVVSGGQVFSAIYRHPTLIGIPLEPFNAIPDHSRIKVAGICVLKNSNPYTRDVPFDILMRSPEDIHAVSGPSWLNVENLVYVACGLLLMVLIVGARGWFLERKMRRQTAFMAGHNESEAALERRRSRILEDINGTRPLAEIIEEIAELVSFKLNGVPCWCQIADGARLGGFPTDPSALRVVRKVIPARSGPPLGVLFAGFDPDTEPSTEETEPLYMGARLATLAIETRRLFSDLVHRSEYDLLTDLHNRFSLDKHLDAQIEEARQKAGIFGLIYIDLDKFKQINDLYGHQIGDLYLQEVALRMKRQLRSVDTLARLGGDEFAALVPMVSSRAAVEEIAMRLERSFYAPFAIEGYVLHGWASVGIAVYPEDGTTKDGLLSAADAAMYVAKHHNHEPGDILTEPLANEFAPEDRS